MYPQLRCFSQHAPGVSHAPALPRHFKDVDTKEASDKKASNIMTRFSKANERRSELKKLEVNDKVSILNPATKEFSHQGTIIERLNDPSYKIDVDGKDCWNRAALRPLHPTIEEEPDPTTATEMAKEANAQQEHEEPI